MANASAVYVAGDPRTARQRILDEASVLFRTRGYDETKIRDVVARAGSSNATLVKYFGNKRGLFAAFVSQFADEIAGLARLSQAADIEDGLVEIGSAILRRLIPDLVMYRSCIGSINGDREIGPMLFEAVFRPIIGSMADYLRSWAARGAVVTDDPDADAERFFNLLSAGPWQRVLLGVQPTVSNGEIEIAARAAARVFLHGIAR